MTGGIHPARLTVVALLGGFLLAGLATGPAWAQQPAAAPTPPATPSAPHPAAQTPRPAPRPATRPLFHVHGFFEVGYQTFAASQTFEATTGSAGGSILGGGGSLTHRSGVFFQVDVTRYAADGQRVFVYGGEVFDLGIPLRVQVTPVEFTFGYRFFTRPPRSKPGAAPAAPSRPESPRTMQARPAPERNPARPAASPSKPASSLARIRPYLGGGFGLVQYSETSDFAVAEEDANERFTSYHVLGGVQLPVWKWIGASAEINYRWVGDAFGKAGVSKEFGENDLGGASFRLKITVGR